MGFGDLAAKRNGNDAFKNGVKEAVGSLGSKAKDKALNTKTGRAYTKARETYSAMQARAAAGKCGNCGNRAGKRGNCGKPACLKAIAEAALDAGEV